MKKHDLKRMTVASAERKAAALAGPDPLPRPAKEVARVTAVALYRDELDWLKTAAALLKRAGFGKTSHSEVVREAIHHLKETLAGKDDREAAEYLRERRARRVSGSA